MKLIKTRKSAVVFAIIAASFASIGIAVCQQQTFEVADTQFPMPTDVTWGLKPWTANDKTLAQARKELDASATSGKLTKSAWALFYADALNNPQKELAQFRWVYATYKAINVGVPFDDQGTFLYKMDERIKNGFSSDSYEWTRIRFLIFMVRGFRYEYRPIAERLLKRNARDFPIRYFYASLLASGRDTSDMGLKEAQRVVKIWPKKPQSYMLLGNIYDARSINRRSESDFKSAIAAYRTAAQLAPPNSLVKKQAEGTIRLLFKIKEQMKGRR